MTVISSFSQVAVTECPMLLDDEVLARSASVDSRAFAELYRRYRLQVYRFLRSRAPDRATAEDLTAHVFLRAFSSAASFRGDGSYRSWIFRIAENTVSSWRARKRSAVALDHVREAADPAPSPLTHVLAHETRRLVRQKITTLPAAQREVVTLYYLEELTPREIAAASARSEGAVRNLLHRARIRLRNALLETQHDEAAA
jgi:RNA polymerase sigma factor (sigma-70 family)